MNIVRLLNVFAFVLLVGSAVSVYRIKYDAIFHAEDVARLERAIEAERTTIAVLNAEWAKRTRPDNIEALARAHLGLTVSTADQTIRLPEIPERPRQEDAIAQALQAMGIVQADPVLTGSAR